MPMLIFIVLAPLGAWIQLRREGRPTDRARSLEVHLLWWLAVTIGVGTTIGVGFHIFDAKATAELIGFTRGDGGFQFENAMGDLAIGVTGLLCIKYRGNFWLAVLLVTAIQFYGDAYGHIYQWIENDNTASGNIGAPLWQDFIVPTVGLILYGLYRRSEHDRAVDGAWP